MSLLRGTVTTLTPAKVMAGRTVVECGLYCTESCQSAIFDAKKKECQLFSEAAETVASHGVVREVRDTRDLEESLLISAPAIQV